MPSMSPVMQRIDDRLLDPAVDHQQLENRHPALAVGRGYEPLADDSLERTGQAHPHLGLLVGREEVHDPVDGLRGVDGMERREHQVTGFCRGQGRRNGLHVPHLADQDHVGVLSQDHPHGRGEGVGVEADLALIDGGQIVGVQILDRVLDGDDMTRPQCG